ncbi:hypothetical protein KQI68_07370 [Peptoniphilus sp. MSJ-1]|uniref:Phage XkdN-like protein n=1 Tax=Peptoniphilus ovalis TaxID=2841503 RepID=A0ABS6FHM8_9FIRM|nr:hypothetical protein [Peptoniphilus ovalis]MBU5669659.1 hypothetical protein [Peptoniphilus ovalis]
MSNKQSVDFEKEQKDIVSALGLGTEVSCFIDEKPRVAYPITLKDYPEFVRAISTINPMNIAQSFFVDNGEGLKNAISMTFGAEAVEEILENVDASNFEEFVKKMFEINGLVLSNDKNLDKDKKK